MISMNPLLQKSNPASKQDMLHIKAKPVVQAKLTVNTPGDMYEQEADAMADRVMRMSSNETVKPVTGLIGKSLQRKCAHCAEEEKRRKPVMRKAEAGSAGMSVSSSFASSLNATKGGGSPLPQGTRSFMENAFSADFSEVRVHTDGNAAEMSKRINAKAFTHGNDIYFNERQYNLDSVEGKHLLAHELTHTVQQQSGESSVIQKQSAPATAACSMTAKRETRGTGFCINGSSSAPNGTSVSFYYIPGMENCNTGDLDVMAPFGMAVVMGGRFSYRSTAVASVIPGIGRLFVAVIGSQYCCTSPVPGSC